MIKETGVVLGLLAELARVLGQNGVLMTQEGGTVVLLLLLPLIRRISFWGFRQWLIRSYTFLMPYLILVQVT
jgi:hypothetical protein